MLNNLFRPSVARSEYDRAIRSYEDTLAIAIKQRDEAQQAHAKAASRELAAIEQRDAYNAIATRALVLLIDGVDTTRTGGKQLAHSIASVKAAAIKCGLWGEVPEKEVK